MIKFYFLQSAKKFFYKLSVSEQNRIIEKITYIKDQEKIPYPIKRILYMEPATHRLRVGHYRFLLKLIIQKNNYYEFDVLEIGHRKDIYR